MARTKRKASASRPAPAISAAANAAQEPAAKASDELRILDREPGKFAFGQWRNVTILAWAAPVDLAEMERLQRALLGVVGKNLGGRSTISVIAEGLPPPTEAAREKVLEILHKNAGELACVAVVVCGTGFSSSVLRSVHTGMRFAMPRSYEMTVLGTVEEVGVWLPPRHATKTGTVLDSANLVEVVKRLQAVATASDPVP